MIKFLRGLFESSKLSRNTTPKLVSILFAIVLYIYVMGEVNPEIEKELNNIKVNLLNKEELENSGLVFIDQNEFTVNVKISGKKNELYKISPDDIKVSADLSGAKQGENIKILQVSKPVNIEIKEITPQQINVRLDKIIKTQRTVEIVKNGNLKRGYETGQPQITPDEILIEGPETKVKSVAKVIGEINVEGVKENIRKNVPVKAVDSQGKDVIGVKVETKNVNVFLPVLKLKNVEIKPVIVGKVKEGYKITNIEVIPKNIMLKGKEDIVNKINEILTKPINVDELDSTLVTEVNLILDERVEMPYLQALPKVHIEVEKIETKEFTFKANQISVNNLNNTLTTNIGDLTQDIKIKISDVRSVLEDVKRSDLELILDAEGLDEGVFILDLRLNKNRGYEDIEITPKSIEIEIYEKKNKEDVVETINNNNNTKEDPLEGLIDMPGN
ncbi:CdaR family protein [Paramaledivibacter caminithermalis]|jgi:YbbR domain-containing protein|uniref:YbbR domain-containing protein n=1 Tax=Paramaledivibacter caminithermalis (strain DSM 15212 / CIP 107654 / DViRD3) TaxID=1121301 RepID=A0A1M6QDA0_PARC5|nr:CdaR family protein [Paramaledivibacter caminithermalis]SHK18222.1 YbbR domain-containing protein [Paramaledivibacter caminithermalis DSM 15212]